MQQIKSFGYWLAVAVLGLSLKAQAWWDTQIQVVRLPPTVLTVPAQNCPGLPATAIVPDPDTATGHAVRLQPGQTPLAFEADCKVSHYFLAVVCRGDDVANLAEAQAKPVILGLRVINLQDNTERVWRQRVTYLADRYEDGPHLYFPVYEPGKYRIEVFSLPTSQATLRVDYLALKDVFAELPRGAEKTGMNLITAAELAAIRQLPANTNLAAKLQLTAAKNGLTDPEKFKDWKAKTCLGIWDAMPPRNLHFTGGIAAGPFTNGLAKAGRKEPVLWTLRRGWGPWTFEQPGTQATYTAADFAAGKTMGDCLFPDDLTGWHGTAATQKELESLTAGASEAERASFAKYQLLAANNWAGAALMNTAQTVGRLAVTRAAEYLKTGDAVAGFEGACALIAFADLYPDIDYQTQNWGFNGGQFGMNPLGKFVYSGWTTGQARELVEAYDRLFPVIQKDPDLAALCRQRVPSLKSNQDLIELLDVNLCRHIRDCVDRQVIRAGEGDSELACITAAVVQGPGQAGDWILQLPLTRCHIRMMNRGGLEDHFFSSTTTDGTDYIGSIAYTRAFPMLTVGATELIARYKALGGKPAVDLSDPAKFPNVLTGAYFDLNSIVAGGYMPHIGETGFVTDPPLPGADKTDRPVYAYAFAKTGDPRFAYWLNLWGREDESDADWKQVQDAAASITRSTFFDNTSRSLPGFGMGILEAGSKRSDLAGRSAVVLRAGVGQGHGGNDQLGLLFYSKGLRLLEFNGRRGGPNSSLRNRWFNTVEVDEKEFMAKKFSSSGVGWTETVNDLGGDLGYMRASARTPALPDLKTYRRDVALIPVGESDAFVFDVFRVDGGKIHTWCCTGPASPEDGVTFTATQSVDTNVVSRYLAGSTFTDRKQAACAGNTQITWGIDSNAIARYFWRDGKIASDVPGQAAVRAWRLNTDGQMLLSAWGGFPDFTGTKPVMQNWVATRKESGTAGLSDAYATVTEGYVNDQPLLKSVAAVPVQGGAAGALAPVAVQVLAANGQSTLAVADGNGDRPLTVGAYRLQGEFACVTKAADGAVTHVALVGGTSLDAEGFQLRPAQARYTATVTRLDIPGNSVHVDAAWPTGLLDGGNFLVWRTGPDHHFSYVVKKVEPSGNSSRLTLSGSLKVYQSAVTHVNPQGDLTLDMPFVLQESEPTYYNGLMVLNDKNELLGPATFRWGERFMFLLKPWHQDWRQRIAKLEDIPLDANGKRTLQLINGKTEPAHRVQPDDAIVATGGVMSTLEVTRVSPAGDMIWFKDPPELYSGIGDVIERSWAYQDRKLVTADGKRTLQANYPGDEIYLGVKGRALTDKDLPDVDGDGRRCVALSQVAPGDVFETPVTASLTREAPGRYRLRANAPVTVQLPAKTWNLIVRHNGQTVSSQSQTDTGTGIPVSTATLQAGAVYCEVSGL